MKHYRAAIIGLGFIGAGDQVSGDRLGQQVSDLDGTHVEALSDRTNVELVAGSSRDLGRRERFAARTRCRTYPDWREMLAAERPEIVSVATYAPQHADMVMACAAAGVKAVYCEKPLTTNLTDGERMIAACRQSGTLLAVNHNRRFHHNYRQLRKFLAEGNIGTLTSGLMQWGTGRLGNVGTHFFDAAVFVTGRRIVAVSGTLDLTGRPDCRGRDFRDPGGWGWLRLESAAGEPPLMIAVDAADDATIPARLVITGTRGRVTTGDKIVRWERPDGFVQTWHEGTGPTSMETAVTEIVEALEGRQTFPNSPDDALHVLEGIVAFHASHGRNGAWVELPLTGADREIVIHCG